MNTQLKSIATFFTLLVTLSVGFAQSNFEGKIVYAITYEDMPAEMQQMESMLPKEMTIHMKGNKSRILQNQMMGSTIIVSDMDAKNGFMEMNMGEQAIRMNISTEEFEKEVNKMPDIEYLDETKNIAGYNCKKAIMKDESGQLAMTVFYTEKIVNQAQKEFAGLKGFPLQYSMSQQNMTVKMIAQEVSEESVLESIFNKSEGYKEMTQEELQQIMMGGGR